MERLGLTHSSLADLCGCENTIYQRLTLFHIEGGLEILPSLKLSSLQHSLGMQQNQKRW